MKEKRTNWMDLFVESINYILITYALSNMAMLFQHSVRNMGYGKLLAEGL